MANLGIVAVALYIVVVGTMIFILKGRFYETLRKGFGASEAEWNRKDTKLAYFRFVSFLGGLITVVIMLVFKYAFLG